VSANKTDRQTDGR